MHRYLVSALALALVASVFAQQAPPPAGEPAAAGEAEVAPPADDDAEAPVSVEEQIDPELFEDEALDEQTYEEDEDVFVPTEEIPADEPIPFPTDI